MSHAILLYLLYLAQNLYSIAMHFASLTNPIGQQCFRMLFLEPDQRVALCTLLFNIRVFYLLQHRPDNNENKPVGKPSRSSFASI